MAQFLDLETDQVCQFLNIHIPSTGWPPDIPRMVTHLPKDARAAPKIFGVRGHIPSPFVLIGTRVLAHNLRQN